MNRHSKRWWALIVALLLVVTACSGDDTDGDTTTTGSADAGTDHPDIVTDIGVDLETGVITVGMLSDLTGAFGPLVTAILAGHEVYWENVNDNGGINGLTVELEVRDTGYDVPAHVELYEELKTQVVAFGHSTGSPHTVAINEALQTDGILAIPLTWYSGWSDPAINSNLMSHGTPYCLEVMNLLSYGMEQAQAAGVESPTVGLVTVPGDYGLDAAAGAQLAVAELGLEVVFDGTGTIIPGQDQTPIAGELVAADPDIVLVATTPDLFTEVYGPAIQSGFEAVWLAPAPSYNPAFLDSPLAEAVQRDLIVSFYVQPWGAGTAGTDELEALFAERRPGAPATDYYAEGFVEAKILHDALLRAYENGDMTQAGVVTAAKSLENVDFNGLAPSESYVGEPNERVQRTNVLLRPDLADRQAGGTGASVVEADYVSDLAAGFEFTEACYQLD